MDLDFKKDALYLDIDGTLLDLAVRADDVVVPPSLPGHLYHLKQKTGGAVAFVSGRELQVIDRLFAPLILPAAGVYGAEIRLSPQTQQEHIDPIPNHLIQAIEQSVGSMQGVVFENKRYAIVVDFKCAPERADIIGKMLAGILGNARQDLVLLKATRAYEIKYKGYTKDRAIQRFQSVPPFFGRRPIFLGDDVVDEQAIDYCRKNGGIGIKIGEEGEALATPQDVRKWIERMASL